MNMAHFIDGLPSYKIVIFHGKLLNNQRVYIYIDVYYPYTCIIYNVDMLDANL